MGPELREWVHAYGVQALKRNIVSYPHQPLHQAVRLWSVPPLAS